MEPITSDMVRRKWGAIKYNLEKFGHHVESELGLFEIDLMGFKACIEKYKATIASVQPRFSMEPLSAAFVTTAKRPAIIKWKSEADKSGYGYTVRGTMTAEIKASVKPQVESWIKAGAPGASTGGVYCSVPNKSIDRVIKLGEHPELLYPVTVLQIEDQWEKFWLAYLALRAETTNKLLAYKTHDPSVFSAHNEAAGTGVVIRGLRRDRAGLDELPSPELDFLARHQIGLGIAYAITQMIRPKNKEDRWVIHILDSRIRGSKGSRSDTDIEDIKYDGDTLSYTFASRTRQVGGDGSGVLANAKTETKYFGRSVVEEAWRRWIAKSRGNYAPVFAGMDNLVKLWTCKTVGKPGEVVVVNEDLGMELPVKAGADTLFSGAYLHCWSLFMPELFSGFFGTTANYVPFHSYYAEKTQPYGGTVTGMGDDISIRYLAQYEKEVLATLEPYKKIKTTTPQWSKILGYLTLQHPEQQDFIEVLLTPRIMKSVSSATAAASDWKETLPSIGPEGSAEIKIPDRIVQAVAESEVIGAKYMYFKGTRAEVASQILTLWTTGRPPLEFAPHWVEHYYGNPEEGEAT